MPIPHFRIAKGLRSCRPRVGGRTAEADGSGRIAIRRSKTDQAADGAVVAITPASMADLERLATIRGGRDPGSPVFGLSDQQIARRAAATRAAGLGGGFSGHSGWVGMAQRTATRADLAAVRSDIAGLRWIVGINIAISLATLAAVLAMAFRP